MADISYRNYSVCQMGGLMRVNLTTFYNEIIIIKTEFLLCTNFINGLFRNCRILFRDLKDPGRDIAGTTRCLRKWMKIL